MKWGKWAPIILNGFHAPAIFTIFLNLFWILSRTTDEWCKLCVKMSVYWKKKMNLLLNSFVKYLNKNAISDILTNKICHNKSPPLVPNLLQKNSHLILNTIPRNYTFIVQDESNFSSHRPESQQEFPQIKSSFLCH